MKRMRSRSRERGQATVEYIFLLAFALFLISLVGRLGVKPIMERIGAAVTASLDRTLFSEDGFHRLRIGR